MELESKIYHEKQSRQLCALHALNNLFQSQDAYSKTDLDNICYSLSPDTWVNPHKSTIVLGNYDVNVLGAALQTKGCDLVWFDKRKDPNIVNLDIIEGCIMNVPNDWKVGFITLPFNRKHWIALKKIDDAWYNLDSKLQNPEKIGSNEEFLKYVESQLKEGNKELFLVVSSEVSESESWRIN